MLILLIRFVSQYGGSCGAAVETAGRRMALQLEGRLRESLERLKFGDYIPTADGNSVGSTNNLEAMLQQLLSATRSQATRLGKLETSCFSNPGGVKATSPLPQGGRVGHREQEVTSHQVALEAASAVLQQTRMEIQEVLSSSRRRRLPAGKLSLGSSFSY